MTHDIEIECDTLRQRCRAAVHRSRTRIARAGTLVAAAQALLDRTTASTGCITAAASDDPSGINAHAISTQERTRPPLLGPRRLISE